MKPAAPVTSTFMDGTRSSQARVDLVGRQHALDVVEDRVVLAEGADGSGTELAELSVRHGENETIVGSRRRGVPQQIEAVLLVHRVRIRPGIVYVHGRPEAAQL